MKKDPFKEYIMQTEPSRRDKAYAWHTAIGLQDVDGLKPSDYLVRTAVRNIEGEISLEEANALLQAYYDEKPADLPCLSRGCGRSMYLARVTPGQRRYFVSNTCEPSALMSQMIYSLKTRGIFVMLLCLLITTI